MAKVRSILGLIGGVILVLSSGAHSILGWRELGAQLAATNAPADLQTGLMIGWRWGGAAMLVLGIIVINTFWKRLRGQAVSAFAPGLTSVAYLAFGMWALMVSGDPFFFIFIVPGVLLALASAP